VQYQQKLQKHIFFLNYRMQTVGSLILVNVLSLGTRTLYLSNGLWCLRGQDKRASTVSNHNIILDPYAQTSEMLWGLVIVLTDIQAWKKKRHRNLTELT
uniref:Uncharacterized protein n=1 Tax=Neogobius melanostomus TaxID=47308 RepID=A0A8C6WKF0_9GOBI